MNILLHLSPSQWTWIDAAATRLGLDVSQVVFLLMEMGLPALQAQMDRVPPPPPPREIKPVRLSRAQEIATSMKNGGKAPLHGNAYDSYWPSKPVIKKDPKAIKAIFGEDE